MTEKYMGCAINIYVSDHYRDQAIYAKMRIEGISNYAYTSPPYAQK